MKVTESRPPLGDAPTQLFPNEGEMAVKREQKEKKKQKNELIVSGVDNSIAIANEPSADCRTEMNFSINCSLIAIF